MGAEGQKRRRKKEGKDGSEKEGVGVDGVGGGVGVEGGCYLRMNNSDDNSRLALL